MSRSGLDPPEMNYFGHAAVATIAGGNDAIVLGAMLPDWYSMLRLKEVPPADPQVALGVRFHLKTDAIFHSTPTFVQCNTTAVMALREAGVSRGPARASAHIGVEMLIDAELMKTSEYFEAYLSALAWGAERASFSESDPKTHQQLSSLCRHLLERGRAVHHTAKERFRERLGHALRGRRRLEPSADELEAIAQYLSQESRVARQVPTLLAELGPLFEKPDCFD